MLPWVRWLWDASLFPTRRFRIVACVRSSSFSFTTFLISCVNFAVYYLRCLIYEPSSLHSSLISFSILDFLWRNASNVLISFSSTSLSIYPEWVFLSFRFHAFLKFVFYEYNFSILKFILYFSRNTNCISF